MFYVYVLQSLKDKRFYIGFSADLKKRVKDHNEGRVVSTKNRRPLDLIYYEAYKFEQQARKQELFYKTGQGRRVLKTRLTGNEILGK
ncbi:MAG: GIY-YIG nuclease family protein [Candidatus Roizmanbacteria bacterium]|nr:MAG: GIY-YIG nuclease family protein [Candidatus Roizmanbacteria bacterium]